MPLYEYRCESCGHVFDEFLSVSDRETPIQAQCPKCYKMTVRMNFGTPPIADPIRMGRIKAPESFRDLLRHIKSRNRGSKLDIN